MVNFISPVKNARLTSPFGWRVINGNKEWHQGVDLASNGNVPIYASADGVVSKAQVLGTYGNVVMIKHTIDGKPYETNYAHLNSYCVKVGQRVKQGQQIGIMGKTGRSYGIHLHFEIHEKEWSKGQPNALDAMKFISLDNDIDNIKKVAQEPTQSASTSKSQQPKKFTSLIDYLNYHKVDSSFNNRKYLAIKNGIKNYTGTAEQNTELLNKLQV